MDTNGTKVRGGKRSWQQVLLRTKVPGPFCSGEQKFQEARKPGMGQGVKGPGSENSRQQIGQGTIDRFAPGSELARERKGCKSTVIHCLL